MKIKIAFLTLLVAAGMWGCGPKKSTDTADADSAKVVAPADTLIHVISLADLGIQSLLTTPKDSLKPEWKEGMVQLKHLHKKAVKKTKKRLMMMSTCCPCVGGAGCCLCTKDTTKNNNAAAMKMEVKMAAPKEVTELELVPDSKSGTPTSLMPQEIDSMNVFTIKRGMPNGIYSLKMKGNFKKEMKCRVEIKDDNVALIPRE